MKKDLILNEAKELFNEAKKQIREFGLIRSGSILFCEKDGSIKGFIVPGQPILEEINNKNRKQDDFYAIFAECPVPWTGMNASGEVRGGEAIPSLAQCREAALLRKSERKLRRFTPRCPDLWSGSFTL